MGLREQMEMEVLGAVESLGGERLCSPTSAARRPDTADMTAVHMPQPLPSPREYGTVGASFFRTSLTIGSPDTWRTIKILGARSAARRLTIDLILPNDPESWIAHDGDEALYCMPVGTDWRRSALHRLSICTTTQEQVLPLLTRAENAGISHRALSVAVQGLLGEKATIDATLGYGLELLVEEEGIPAEIAAAIYGQAARVHKQLNEGHTGRRLSQVVSQLQANSMIWLPLRGEPGQRRVIKLAYRIPLKVPVVPPANRRCAGSRSSTYLSPRRLGSNLLESIRNVASRATAATGFAAIKITVHDPVVQDPCSYRFQVRTPAGVRLEEIARHGSPRGTRSSFTSVRNTLPSGRNTRTDDAVASTVPRTSTGPF